MTISSNPPAMTVAGRLIRLVSAPRSAMADAVRLPFSTVVATWVLLLAVWAAAAGVLLSTAVGRQGLVDERVRVVEGLGRQVDDATYAQMQSDPPLWVYFTSGGRLLLTPPVTVTVAVGLFLWLRRRAAVTFVQCLSVAVHASVALVVQQVMATPFHLVRESLTSPFNLAALLPFFDEGSAVARFLGTVEAFGLWWVLLLAMGCAALAGGRARGFLAPLVATYAGVAAVVAAAVLLTGGS
ncbi:MAG: hypothetical protein ABI880_13645 [Acidobacteriota bacterium]